MGDPINPEFKYLAKNLLYCLENEYETIFDANILSEKLSRESKDIIWEEKIKSIKEYKGEQPVYYVDKMKKFIEEKKLPKDFYPYFKVNWNLFQILKGSQFYESKER